MERGVGDEVRRIEVVYLWIRTFLLIRNLAIARSFLVILLLELTKQQLLHGLKPKSKRIQACPVRTIEWV